MTQGRICRYSNILLSVSYILTFKTPTFCVSNNNAIIRTRFNYNSFIKTDINCVHVILFAFLYVQPFTLLSTLKWVGGT